ncbi:hypothetical protein LAJ19_18230 (plasmid) [Deinococcus taeanensis]|uniref:hypothetical protein n=1 Tax=Deinococcus taeanensis TaxID=2737050 RepID=UPI001CDC4C30|nr:hypothetical protein [Deinococcus taeanensis]UBV45063.1 hypothetical protein LAJ19_18230 [Deinococcus taeanensis]
MTHLNRAQLPVQVELRKEAHFWLCEGVPGFHLDALPSLIPGRAGIAISESRTPEAPCPSLNTPAPSH